VPSPFIADVVVNPENPALVDVREIHHQAFTTCCQALDRVATEQSSWSILFYGEAGCGKTHLLARFRRWIYGELDGAGSERAPKALFVAVRMETAPSRLWRHLRRRLAERLVSRDADGGFPLNGMLERFAARHGSGDLARAFEQSEITDISLGLTRVLEHFHAGCHRALAKAWLVGDPLHDRDIDALGLPPIWSEDYEDEAGEAAARQFVLAMTCIIAPLPVVYCLDQLEALQLGPGGYRGYGPFAKMCASLVDETRNTLVVSSILLAYLNDLRNGALRSDYDRLTKDVVDLHPLTWSQGKALIEARLVASSELAEYRKNGGVAPLTEEDLRKPFAESGRCTARKLIHHARDLFERWRGQVPPPPPPVLEFLRGTLERFWEESLARSGPELMDDILAHGVPAVAAVTGHAVRESCRRGVDLCIGAEPTPVLVAFCNNGRMTSLARRLRNLEAGLADDEHKRLVLVRDLRLPISPGAKKTLEYLEKLKGAGARLVRPNVEAVTALDAIRRLLAMAQSGDLVNGGEIQEPQTVRDWLAANLPEPVRNLMDELTGASTSPPNELDAILELLNEKLIISAEEAARHTGLSLEQLEIDARANPDQIGYLAGPPAVMFYVAPAAAGGLDEKA
jgi:hypothetical protein